ncbi:hypothetical protein [Limnochorda pilosa]|uniref:Uncharacterized protein n=1 Tax=Limnochorda pilosa TaxID=1555112 RepID=A0A0K2SRB4_LIMPI|nr:hypothetical protein [Limnochorda pilosa]BAS29384.1 hypothetical protein LIP_3573 [Limnochorda pilosa]
MADRWSSVGADRPTADLIRLVARVENISVVHALRAALDLAIRSRYGSLDGLKEAAKELRVFRGFDEEGPATRGVGNADPLEAAERGTVNVSTPRRLRRRR